MAVGVGRKADVLVPQNSLHAVEIDAGAQQERGGRMPNPVEVHRARDRDRPELHAAGLATAERVVGELPLGRSAMSLATAADVSVALDEASAREGMAEHLLRVELLFAQRSFR